ncbi:MAG: peptidoglycan DD-metalloendopeptidase family protein [Oscillospiraceae bacterium]|nr:peptidoglycan DD-metalloendopeptidase family protein [Oscillospiraceae bacterium]
MNKQVTRLFAVLAAACITAGSVIYRAEQLPENKVEAKTLAEIEAEKKEKQAEIDRKKEELEKLQNDIGQKEAYQQTLLEEIDLINGKMFLIDTQIQNVNVEIIEKQDEIAALDADIVTQQAAVDEGTELFKQRIRVLYIYGNDSMLSALVGATDFYDVLSRFEMIKRISKHDDDLINGLRRDIDKLTKLQQDKTASLQALNLKEAELQSYRSEFADSRAELDAVVANTDLEKQMLMQERSQMNESLSLSEDELDALREEGEQIILEAAKKAAEEAAKKAAEEEARKKKEEEARRAAEEAKKTTTTVTTTKKATTATTTKKTTTTTAKKTTAPTTAATTKKTTTTAKPAVTTAKTTAATTTTTKAATKQTTAATTATAKPTTSATTVTTAPTTAATTTTKVTTTAAPSGGNVDYRGGSFAWPVPGYYDISSPFGPRWGKIHKGMDIISYSRAINGANVYPCKPGTVITAAYGWNWGFGNYIQIDHGNGLVTLYAHLSSISVSTGQKVQLGQKIGNVGSTGNSTGPHLHLGVILNGQYVNPAPYLY